MDTKKILKKHNIRPKKNLGQNFLIDNKIAERQVGYAEIKPGERVLEIGGGLGTLTQELIKKPCKVIVIEKDPKLQNILQKRFGEKITLIKGDALETSFEEIDKVVANLPYQISSEITFKILRQPFKKAILMYQKEFAERMTAKPGTKEYGRLTIGVDLYSKAEILEKIPKNAFYPQPKITSAIVKLTPKKPSYTPLNQDFFLNFTKAIFSQRRKKLKNAIQNTRHMMKPKPSKQTTKNAIKQIGELTEKRPGKLTPSQIANCSNKLYKEIKKQK
ncbi:16S rRNA (adenine(1518)-N(6)/adenine(1519)-N(6))-dimethyltransferase RsmA [Methanonatronarchaeum sp. AMET-Sl]|uniref:16S rRNA (adenine(1518)-N(6)/adenine(1519)-N(6))- dimethyltransferase RsmA n=1 Tax=Methanonatronarchaeum sp. AMET-Sl TaxID=3037654 RepID=UPI00244DEB1A|nr:16S rRNA (adenine(1518)-N(6)/adenine(1519)-N(6))-dimethyltransferase RsmA [Methanonatronarchaeum sp. AMET-Sl]WGI16759.1 16S rRNA (adenine(1518)-N(6)/adenine(1519)-N(6))-dimethyltransferase RsmA [Methanonatronarchaeum sp. AMET-Sl]